MYVEAGNETRKTPDATIFMCNGATVSFFAQLFASRICRTPYFSNPCMHTVCLSLNHREQLCCDQKPLAIKYKKWEELCIDLLPGIIGRLAPSVDWKKTTPGTDNQVLMVFFYCTTSTGMFEMPKNYTNYSKLIGVDHTSDEHMHFLEHAQVW